MQHSRTYLRTPTPSTSSETPPSSVAPVGRSSRPGDSGTRRSSPCPWSSSSQPSRASLPHTPTSMPLLAGPLRHVTPGPDRGPPTPPLSRPGPPYASPTPTGAGTTALEVGRGPGQVGQTRKFSLVARQKGDLVYSANDDLACRSDWGTDGRSVSDPRRTPLQRRRTGLPSKTLPRVICPFPCPGEVRVGNTACRNKDDETAAQSGTGTQNHSGLTLKTSGSSTEGVGLCGGPSDPFRPGRPDPGRWTPDKDSEGDPSRLRPRPR